MYAHDAGLLHLRVDVAPYLLVVVLNPCAQVLVAVADLLVVKTHRSRNRQGASDSKGEQAAAGDDLDDAHCWGLPTARLAVRPGHPRQRRD